VYADTVFGGTVGSCHIGQCCDQSYLQDVSPARHFFVLLATD